MSEQQSKDRFLRCNCGALINITGMRVKVKKCPRCAVNDKDSPYNYDNGHRDGRGIRTPADSGAV